MVEKGRQQVAGLLGCAPEVGMGAIRFSLGRTTRAEEIDAVAARLSDVLLYPPVTLMWRPTAGRRLRRSMTKSWPLGLRDIASSMAA